MVALGLAMASWCGSFWFGVRGLQTHHKLGAIASGQTIPSSMEAIRDQHRSLMFSQGWQLRLLPIGAAFYVVWQFLDMYQRTLK